jgi:hypothetical protein
VGVSGGQSREKKESGDEDGQGENKRRKGRRGEGRRYTYSSRA